MARPRTYQEALTSRGRLTSEIERFARGWQQRYANDVRVDELLSELLRKVAAKRNELIRNEQAKLTTVIAHLLRGIVSTVRRGNARRARSEAAARGEHDVAAENRLRSPRGKTPPSKVPRGYEQEDRFMRYWPVGAAHKAATWLSPAEMVAVLDLSALISALALGKADERARNALRRAYVGLTGVIPEDAEWAVLGLLLLSVLQTYFCTEQSRYAASRRREEAGEDTFEERPAKHLRRGAELRGTLPDWVTDDAVDALVASTQLGRGGRGNKKLTPERGVSLWIDAQREKQGLPTLNLERLWKAKVSDERSVSLQPLPGRNVASHKPKTKVRGRSR